MANKVAHACFEAFHKHRVDFVSEVADMAAKPHYIQSLLAEGVMEQLRPLLTDRIDTVKQTAALALGRLASASPEIAHELVIADILPELVEALKDANVRIQPSGV